ncbi:FecR family protein [Pseudoflavitalea rhizosphaerae]|uniref:FecR family protein n=1 Tax=Pseudoflavitalea rhizosphaerae TaxID=1884793 RepID=UPI000F8E5DB2|nr:FecR domain-containing protein [Pseudoflavitalea rhizosphaerae]
MTDAIIEKIATGNYSEEELHAFLEELKDMNDDDYKAIYNKLYRVLPDIPDRQMSDAFHIEMEKQLDSRESMEEAIVVTGWRKWRYYAAAAVLLLVLAGGIYWYLQPDQHRIFAAKNGERKSVRLPDGSQVIINSGSTLSLSEHFDETDREVTLEGEVYFDIKSNEKKPFIIHTKASEVKVLGTAFNVRAYPSEETEVASLVRGAIQVRIKTETGLSGEYLLKPMQKMIIRKTGQVEKDKTVQVEKKTKLLMPRIDSIHVNKIFDEVVETAWTKNKLVFDNETLQQAAARMQQWYGIEIRIENDSLKNLLYTASFEGETLEKVLEAIQFSIPMVKYKMENNGLYILY